MIYVNERIRIPESELDEKFVRSAGPGGQNVNKVSTAVQIRFNLRTSRHIPEDVKHRMFSLYGGRISGDGILTVSSDVHRTQLQNREEALSRFIDLLNAASIRPKIRRKTRATGASKRKRLDSKKRHSAVKRDRNYSAGAE